MDLHWIQFLCLTIYLGGYVSGGIFGNRWKPYGNSGGNSRCKADAREPWSYKGKNGPQSWGERYPNCKGKQQSPISINTHKVIFDSDLPKLIMNNYDIPITRGTIENDGRTILVNATDGIERSIYINNDIYRLAQFHFHWGDAYYKGSEHVIDGNQYAMEMHLVHQNARNEIAVLAVFFKEQKIENEELQIIIDHFPLVTYRNMRTQLKQKINLHYLLPEAPASYFRYAGSLTTPECDEGVTWTLLIEPQPVGLNQMGEFRKLYSATKEEATRKCKLSNNIRPTQPLNYRNVFVSH